MLSGCSIKDAPTILHQYQNGNAEVVIYSDGTRTITFEGEPRYEFPLNIDIRVMSKCPFGMNPKTGKAVCAFCHESATVDGKECDYDALIEKLTGLPPGIEIAIGGNILTEGLEGFVYWCKEQKYICNLTVNQMNLTKRNVEILKRWLDDEAIYGLGISYRKGSSVEIDPELAKHDNVVLHVIAGIDDVDEVAALPIKKILVLGYKRFGFGEQFFSEEVEQCLKVWNWRLPVLFDGRVVSFDNLALEQLNVKRFLTQNEWSTFYQGEHSFYINAVDQTFAPSSRSPLKESWNNQTVKSYFTKLETHK